MFFWVSCQINIININAIHWSLLSGGFCLPFIPGFWFYKLTQVWELTEGHGCLFMIQV